MRINIIEKDGKKYIDGEEILYELSLGVNIYKIFIAMLGPILFFIYAKIENYNVGIIYIIFLLIFFIYMGAVFIRNIQNLYRGKMYLTKNHIMLKTGVIINIENIYFFYSRITDSQTGFFSQTELNFYNENKFNFMFFIIVNEKNEDFKKLIQVLYDISGNENILIENMNFMKSRQKLTIGKENGRKT